MVTLGRIFGIIVMFFLKKIFEIIFILLSNYILFSILLHFCSWFTVFLSFMCRYRFRRVTVPLPHRYR